MHVLLVDDDYHVLEGLKRNVCWEALGVKRVFEALGTTVARKMIQTEHIDIMICDIEMPRETGLELLEWIRENKLEIEAIFLTSYADFEYARTVIRLKGLDYIMKPIDYERMEKAIASAVQQVEINRRNESICNKRSSGQRIAIESQNVKNQEEKVSRQYSQEELQGKTGKIVNVVKAYIDEHFRESISREELSQMVYLNPDYLSRVFKKEQGISISTYLIQCRLDEAKKLLRETKMPVSVISMEVGYDNFAYFTKIFKEKTGVSPNEYRKSRMGKKE